MPNEVKVTICGKEYKLKTSESPNYVFALARALESKINEIINSGSGSSPYGASIMVVLRPRSTWMRPEGPASKRMPLRRR